MSKTYFKNSDNLFFNLISIKLKSEQFLFSPKLN